MQILQKSAFFCQNNENINSKTEIKKSGDSDNNFDFQKTQWSREKAKKVQEEITKWKSFVNTL